MRVGRSVPSSNSVLVVGGLANMRNKCLMDKIIKYNYDVSRLRNSNMVSVLEEGLQESQNSTRNQPRICLGSSSTMLNHQYKYASFLDNFRGKWRLRWKKSQNLHISTGKILWAGLANPDSRRVSGWMKCDYIIIIFCYFAKYMVMHFLYCPGKSC